MERGSDYGLFGSHGVGRIAAWCAATPLSGLVTMLCQIFHQIPRRNGVNTMRLLRLCVLFFVMFAVSSGRAISPELQTYIKVDAGLVVLTHVRVIDGSGGAARENQAIVIGGGRIVSAGPASNASIPAQAKVMDLPGYTVIPGLVGMHDHMFYPTSRGNFAEMAYSFPRLYLASGVTTIRTTGSIEPYADLEIKRQIEEGKTPGPKMHVTGPYLEGEGSWAVQMHQLKGPEDATKTVNFWLDQGVDNFKAYMFITPAELDAAAIAAHKRNAKITGHLCSIGFREAAALGIDDLEHGLLTDTEFFPWKKAGECPDKPESMEYISKLDVNSGPVREMIAYLVQHHVAVTSTLPVFEIFVPGRPSIPARVLDGLSPDGRANFLANKLAMADRAGLKRRYGSETSPWPGAFQKEMEFEYAFAKAGGLLLAGEDPTGAGGDLAGFGDQREVELLVEAGFTPVEAIHIATENGAQYLGESGKTGTIAAGKQADLVVIKGDPSRRIEDIENVEIVFKDGVGYDSAKLIESVRGQVGAR